MAKRKVLPKLLSMLLVLCMVVTCLPITALSITANAAGNEAFRPQRVLIISDGNPEGTELGQKVSLVASEFMAKSAADNLTVVYGSDEDVKADDLVIRVDENLAEQEYNVTAAGEQADVTAGSPVAVMYGMREVLKSLVLGNEVADAAVTPDVNQRILHLDCGRKYYSKDWIIALVKELSWLQMNQLEIDFSNGTGFRIALDDMMLDVDGDGIEETDISMLPGGTTDPEGYLTESDLNEIIATAKDYGVEIIPNLDTPGHLGWILGKEEFSGYQNELGLNITDPEATNFVAALVKKYAAYFLSQGCTTFHLGGDEYIHSSPSWMGNIDTSAYYTEISEYLDNLAGGLKAMGYKKIRLFNDALYYNNDFETYEWKNIDEASYWSSGMWGFYFATPSALAEKGIRLINSNGDFYNVLNNGGDWKELVGSPDKMNAPAGILNLWKNDVFQTLWSAPNDVVTADKANIDGSTFFMWCDKPDAGTQQEVAASLYPRLRSAAAKMVDDTLSISYEEFAATFTDSAGGFTRDGQIQNIALPEVGPIVKADSEAIEISRVVILGRNNPAGTELAQKVSVGASEFMAKDVTNALEVVYGTEKIVQAGDLAVKVDTSLDEQEYKVAVADGVVTVTAGAPISVLYGMRAVLKNLELGQEVADVAVNPDVDMRILHLDCGRKYFSKDWIIALVKELSWLEMNELELDFSNGTGFRFALDDMILDADGDGIEETDISMLPGGTTDPEGYLTEADMNEIIATAKAYGVEIVPNLDTPGHMGWILGKADFSKYQNEVGLDVTNPEALQFVGAIVKKYAAYFLSQGCTTFHLGGDEYIHSSPSWMGNTDTSVYYDDVANYLDNLAGELKAMGYEKTRLFNDSLYYNEFTSHEWKNIDEASYWSSGMWGFYFTQPRGLAEKGIRLINSNQSYYNVLNNNNNWKLPVGDPETKKSPAGIYSQWKNDVFETLWSDPDNLVTAEKEDIDGSTYFMWCDRAEAGTQQEVAVSLYPRLRSAAAKMVDDTLSGTYEDFAETFTDSVGGFTRDGQIQSISLPEVPEIGRVYGDGEVGEKLIVMIEGLDSSEYTEESWAAVADALETAKAVVENPDASQADKDAALSDLVKAFGKLEYGVQKLHLATAIKAADSILALADNYVSEAADLAAAVEAGRVVLADKSAAQEEVDNAAYAVLDELAKLAKKADISSLESLVEAAKNLLDGNYTDSSLKDLADAIEKAEEVIADQNRGENDIADAYSNLIDAIINLVMKGSKAALHAMIVKADEVLENKDAYVASTIEGLADVLAKAKEVYADDNAVQSIINDAVVELTLKVADARLLGDVDNDGAVTTSDSAVLLRYAAEFNELDAEAAESADVNGDGAADTSDAALILQYAAEKVAAF